MDIGCCNVHTYLTQSCMSYTIQQPNMYAVQQFSTPMLYHFLAWRLIIGVESKLVLKQEHGTKSNGFLYNSCSVAWCTCIPRCVCVIVLCPSCLLWGYPVHQLSGWYWRPSYVDVVSLCSADVEYCISRWGHTFDFELTSRNVEPPFSWSVFSVYHLCTSKALSVCAFKALSVCAFKVCS